MLAAVKGAYCFSENWSLVPRTQVKDPQQLVTPASGDLTVLFRPLGIHAEIPHARTHTLKKKSNFWKEFSSHFFSSLSIAYIEMTPVWERSLKVEGVRPTCPLYATYIFNQEFFYSNHICSCFYLCIRGVSSLDVSYKLISFYIKSRKVSIFSGVAGRMLSVELFLSSFGFWFGLGFAGDWTKGLNSCNIPSFVVCAITLRLKESKAFLA